jgi:hypothetical protein
MNISKQFLTVNINHFQFYREYSANALLPDIDWQALFPHSKLNQPMCKP